MTLVTRQLPLRPACVFIVLLFLSGSVHAEAPASVTDGEVVRLEQAISEASEQGHLDKLWTLRHQLADYSKQNGYYAQAARQYELLLATRPSRKQRVLLSVELGRMRDAQKDYRGAIQAYEDALHDDSRNWEARLLLGRAYASVDLFKQSETTYLAALKQNQASPEAHRELASLYLKRGYLQKAQSSFETAIRLDPKDSLAYLGLADTCSRMSNFQAAFSALERGAGMAPSPEYLVRMGGLYRRQGDPARAAQAWETALKQNPGRDDVRLQLVLLYRSSNRREDAERLLRKLLSAYPRSPLVHFVKAWMLMDRGDRAGARQSAQDAERLNPTEVVRHYNDKLIERLEQGL